MEVLIEVTVISESGTEGSSNTSFEVPDRRLILYANGKLKPGHKEFAEFKATLRQAATDWSVKVIAEEDDA